MAVRTTAENVGKVIELDNTIDVTPFIEVASVMVDELCTPPAGPATPYSDTRLEQIERWLAAHFYGIRDKQTRSEGVGPLNESYEGQTGQGLQFTRYGQMAMQLDTNGGLAQQDWLTRNGKKRIQGGVFWAGKRCAGDPRPCTDCE